MSGYSYLFIAVIGTTIGQLSLKVASGKKLSFRNIIFNPYIYIAFISIAVIPFLINLALDFHELSVVFAFTGLYYVSVPLAAHFLLKERLTLQMLFGMVLIVLGVALFHLR